MVQSEEVYCPICGKRDFSILSGKHKCTQRSLRAEEARLAAYDDVPKDPPIGQQIEDGFDMLRDFYYEEQ